MFCGECGAKNNQGDRFCLECGKPLVQEDLKQNTTNVVKKTRQPMSKKNKIIIAVIVGIAVILGAGYKVGSDMTSPKTIAKDYIKAVVDKDSDRLYKYLEIEGDKTFVSKKIFKELTSANSSDSSSSITNYKITNVEYGDGKLTAKVNFTYTTEGSSTERTDTVNLVKGKDKKFFIFDDWKIADLSVDSLIVKDYKIKATKGTVITFSGVKLTDKYLDKKESTTKLDVYSLPQVFTTNNTLKAVLPGGIEVEEEVRPSSYSASYTVSFDEDNLTDAAKDKIITKTKEILVNIYQSAMENKKFSDIKSNYEHGNLDLTNLETNYNEFLEDLTDSSTTLTSIDITKVTLSDLELNEDGNFEVEVKVNYDYSVSYTNWDDEVETHDDSDYDYMTIVLKSDKDSYYLVDIESIEYYFSRY